MTEREWALKRRAELVQEQEKALALLNRVSGAITVLDELLALPEEEESDDE